LINNLDSYLEGCDEQTILSMAGSDKFIQTLFIAFIFLTSCLLISCDERPSKSDHQTNFLNGEFVLNKHTIDSGIEEGDGQSMADIDGDGKNNIIVGTGDGGEVYWYEKNSPSNWTRYLITDSFIEVEGTLAADFNGDGQIEVIILDQATADPQQPNVFIAKQDSDDPKGTWSLSVLDENAPHVQQGIVFDVNDNGISDFVYAYEGLNDGEGGFYWMEFKGGNPLNANNWTKHEIGQMEGAWWIDYNSPKDFNNNGNSGDILVSARAGGRAPSSASGGIFIYLRPDDPTQPWEKIIVDNDYPVLQISSGDLTGNGDNRDIAAGASHDSDDSGLFIYDFENDWNKNVVEENHNWWGTYVFDINQNGQAEIIAGERTNDTIRIYAFDKEEGRYTLRVSDPFIKPDDQIIFDDISEDGNVTEFFTGSDPDGVFWYQAFQVEE
jgi:hypothetical protein